MKSQLSYSSNIIEQSYKAIPEALGFIHEGVKREGQWLYDHYEDIVTYSLLKKDWEDINSHLI